MTKGNTVLSSSSLQGSGTDGAMVLIDVSDACCEPCICQPVFEVGVVPLKQHGGWDITQCMLELGTSKAETSG